MDLKKATISLVDCRELDLLAETCREIFSSNRAGIASLEGSYRVQKYRSRMKPASRSMVISSSGSASRGRSTAFSPSGLPSSTERTTPSHRRLPRPKGTITRIPGTSPIPSGIQ